MDKQTEGHFKICTTCGCIYTGEAERCNNETRASDKFVEQAKKWELCEDTELSVSYHGKIKDVRSYLTGKSRRGIQTKMIDKINQRFKDNYEEVTQINLTRRMPVIIRLDGKAFHSITAKLEKPYCAKFNELMQITMLELCKEIQNVKIGYQQSDEISLLLVDYTTLETEQWFGGKIQKMASVSAALATYFFNKLLWLSQGYNESKLSFESIKLCDSRVFCVPREEVSNYFIARQKDATRNAILGMSQFKFGKKDVMNLNLEQLQEKLFTEAGVNFNDLPTVQKRGACCIKVCTDNIGFTGDEIDRDTLERAGRCSWEIDKEIPIFTADRKYIDEEVYPLVTLKADNKDES
jgi:tRNA(His) 5'-end guanylyltransferase